MGTVMSERSCTIRQVTRRQFLRCAAAAAGVTHLGACRGGSNGGGGSSGPYIALGIRTAPAGSPGAMAIETYHTKASAYPASLLLYQDWGVT
jgi:hypothetical protein